MKKQRKDWKKVKKLLQWAWENRYSSFYKDKYATAGFKNCKQISNIEVFKKLPYLTRSEIVEKNPFDLLFVREDNIRGVSITSGTTNQNSPLVLFRERWQLRWNKNVLAPTGRLHRDLKKLGVKRLLILFSPMRANAVSLKPQSSFTEVFVDINNLPFAAQVAAKARIEAIDTTPTILYFFIPYLKKQYDLSKITYIRLTGEFCSLQKYKLLRETFPNAIFNSFYGGGEDTARGWQCDYLAKESPSKYHLVNNHYYEFIDPVTNEEVGAHQEAELVTTSFFEDAFVVIRYKTGDLVRLLDTNCPCESKDPLFEVLGKVGLDSFKLHGFTLTTKTVSRSLEKLTQDILPDFKIHIYEVVKNKQVLPLLEIDLIPKNLTLIENAVLKRRIEKIIQDNLFISPKLTLSDLVNQKAALPLKVRLIREFPFEAKRRVFIPHLT